MLSKVIVGDSAEQAPSLVWSKLGSGIGPHAESPGGDYSHGISGAGSLENRIAQLESEITTREKQAMESGFQQGQAAALKTLEAPLKQAMERMVKQIQELVGVRKRLRREAEADLVRLAMEIARRVLHRELSADPEAILGLAKAALERIDARDVLQVRAHPEDTRILETCLADLGYPKRIEVMADQHLERGAIILETSRGQLDASADTQLQEIERGFADLLQHKS